MYICHFYHIFRVKLNHQSIYCTLYYRSQIKYYFLLGFKKKKTYEGIKCTCCPTEDVLCIWCFLSMFSSRISPYMSSRDVPPPSLSVHVFLKWDSVSFLSLSVLFSRNLFSFLSSISVACSLLASSKKLSLYLGSRIVAKKYKGSVYMPINRCFTASSSVAFVIFTPLSVLRFLFSKCFRASTEGIMSEAVAMCELISFVNSSKCASSVTAFSIRPRARTERCSICQ